MSDEPCTPTGRMTLRLASTFSGTAQAPGAIEYPSDSEAAVGRPRMRRKLFLAGASGELISMGRRVLLAGCALTTVGTTMTVRCCASAVRPGLPTSMSPATVATTAKQAVAANCASRRERFTRSVERPLPRATGYPPCS